jgi:hypothetical protein
MAPPPMPCSPNRMAAQPHNRGTGVGEYETEREAAMPARQKTPDGAEPLIIQEGGEPTSSDDKPTDKSGNAKERRAANDPADRTVFRRG